MDDDGIGADLLRGPVDGVDQDGRHRDVVAAQLGRPSPHQHVRSVRRRDDLGDVRRDDDPIDPGRARVVDRVLIQRSPGERSGVLAGQPLRSGAGRDDRQRPTAAPPSSLAC